MPPIISLPTTTHVRSSTTFTMTNAHNSHTASQVYSWRVKVGSTANGYNYYLGVEMSSNGNNAQNDTAPKPGLPGGGNTCYTKVEYRKVAAGPWYSGTTSAFTCM